MRIPPATDLGHFALQVGTWVVTIGTSFVVLTFVRWFMGWGQ